MTCANEKGTAFPEFITALPRIDIPLAGARGWMMQGADQQVVFVEFSKTVEVPDHSHEDQWELPVAGRVELRREGNTEEYGAGDSFFIPAGQAHGATVHAGYRAIIAFNAPDRYRPKD
jgi:mannose-6-phosphate isomerase-like protein (cupin superfamily)